MWGGKAFFLDDSYAKQPTLLLESRPIFCQKYNLSQSFEEPDQCVKFLRKHKRQSISSGFGCHFVSTMHSAPCTALGILLHCTALGTMSEATRPTIELNHLVPRTDNIVTSLC